jgi:hypothetical protein
VSADTFPIYRLTASCPGDEPVARPTGPIWLWNKIGEQWNASGSYETAETYERLNYTHWVRRVDDQEPPFRPLIPKPAKVKLRAKRGRTQSWEETVKKAELLDWLLSVCMETYICCVDDNIDAYNKRSFFDILPTGGANNVTGRSVSYTVEDIAQAKAKRDEIRNRPAPDAASVIDTTAP